MKNSIKLPTLLLLGMGLWALTTQAQQDGGFYRNPLTINGHSLNQATVALNSRGVLALVKGDPESVKSERVPFRAYLRRAGAIIHDTYEGYGIDLARLLTLARYGDELVVEPVRSTDRMAKRVLKLREYNFLVSWLTRDGC